MKRYSAGFTIVELLVVVAIVSILSSVLYFNASEGSAQSRDVERKSDLREIQVALELYKNENGRYPTACNGPTGWGADGWSGQAGSAFECASGNQYIENLAPKYIKTLPSDPKLNGSDSGYLYAVNADGTVYKFMARNTVESEVVKYTSDFSSCDATYSSTGLCDAVTSNGNNLPSHCGEWNSQFQTSYAVWGGYADETSDLFVERRTEDIICK